MVTGKRKPVVMLNTNEYSEAEKMVKLALDIAVTKKAKKITRLVIEVGKLSPYDPQIVKTALTSLVSGTMAGSAKIEVKPSPSMIKCRCGFGGEPKIFGMSRNTVAECPKCGRTEVIVLGGQGMRLGEIDIDYGEAPKKWK